MSLAHVRAFIEGAHSDPANRVLSDREAFSRTRRHGHRQSHGSGESRRGSRTHGCCRTSAFSRSHRAGVDAVMTAHMAVPAYEPEEIPATVSEKVLTGLLRQD